MKNILFAAFVAILTSSCQGVAGWFGSDDDSLSHTSASAALAPERDQSITAENAYSDLFIDTAVVSRYIQTKNLDEATAEGMRHFYNVRNFQYAWFASDGFTEQGRGFWNLYDQQEENSDKSLRQRMDSLLENDSLQINGGDTSFVQAELALTEKFMRFARDRSGEDVHGFAQAYYMVPARKADAMQLADSILNRQKEGAQYESNKIYTGLKNALKQYYTLAKNGGSQPVSLSGKSLQLGATGPAVVAVKKHMAATGYYTTADTSAQYNDSLAAAVRNYQVMHGFAPTGMVNDSLVRIMNVPATQRVQQILVNMNRALWLPAATDSVRLEVNIPAFMLYAYEGDGKVFEMPVVVGREGTNTMMFSGELNQVVFSPYWNIPESIVREEILPAMQKDATYLKKNNMEVVKNNGNIPVIRQLPGKDNSLGKVKFLFPNSYDIYFHDTPAKGLFNQSNRAASHGCIRLADAEKMANYLLRDQKDWTPEKIRAAMNSGKEQTVKLNNPADVHIRYLTAWADEQGRVHFYNDVYGHDARTASRMFYNSGLRTPAQTAASGNDTANARHARP